MSILNLILLLIVIFRKKIKNPEAAGILRSCLWIGVAYWSTIFISVSLFKINPTSFPFNPLALEIAVKGFTTYLFYKALKKSPKGSERTYIYWLIGIASLDLAMNIFEIF